jgi:hypothetical protein
LTALKVLPSPETFILFCTITVRCGICLTWIKTSKNHY